MTRLVWAEPSSRVYSEGIDRGLISSQGSVVVWNGLVSVEPDVDVADRSFHVDGIKQIQQTAQVGFIGTISAYTYPDELYLYEETYGLSSREQAANTIAFSYRTNTTNIETGQQEYDIHLVYNALIVPAEQEHESIADGADALLFSWTVSTTPVQFREGVFGSHLIVKTARAYSWALSAFEELLYGSTYVNPVFPTIEEVLALFEEASIVRITDNGDGTWTAEGPDSAVYLTSATSFEIDWPSVVFLDQNTYRVASL